MSIPEDTRPPGTTTIAADVLLDITRLTAEQIPGVCRLAAPPSVGRMFRGAQAGGVRVQVVEDTVNLDIHAILRPDTNLRQVSRNMQTEVARAIEEMVGMRAGQINIHIEDIEYAAPEA